MKGLRILDLSYTKIQRLPRSVVALENIFVLLLRYCYDLQSMPDLSKLKNLTRLDLHSVYLVDFPQGIEKLVKLVYLDLDSTMAQAYPKGLLSKFTELRYLAITLPESAGLESAEDLTTLNKLETLKTVFFKFELFHSYFKSARPLCDFRIQLGYGLKLEAPKSISLNCKYSDYLDLPIAIPNNVEVLHVTECNTTSLCRLLFVEDMKNLQKLTIIKGMTEYIFYHSPAIFPLLSNIKELTLISVSNLRALIGHEGDGTVPLPFGAFSALKYLSIETCHVLKTVFVVDKGASFPHLEELVIDSCTALEEIIRYEDEDAIRMELPALKSITLIDLRKLKSAEFVANSLTHRVIRYCPELKKDNSSLLPFVCVDSDL